MINLATKIIEMTSSASQIIKLPALDEGDMTRRLPDISKMKEILDKDLTSLEDGIKLMMSASH
jgi:UDP-glucose 4-epimerase